MLGPLPSFRVNIVVDPAEHPVHNWLRIEEGSDPQVQYTNYELKI